LSFSISFKTSARSIVFPANSIAPVGHASEQLPQRSQSFLSIDSSSPRRVSALLGQASEHSKHRVHLFFLYSSSGVETWPSGLWHHAHLRGHPFRNTVVRIPGPSSVAYLLMSNTTPSVNLHARLDRLNSNSEVMIKTLLLCPFPSTSLRIAG
jgi:hypothetical protein